MTKFNDTEAVRRADDVELGGSGDMVDGGSSPTRAETARYIVSMLEQLEEMAHAGRLDVLGVMLAMALEQARDEARDSPT
ncbi:MAG: hypothetical protein AAF739_13025 [Pseudomonadota bacterium]